MSQCKEFDIVIDASSIAPLPITVNDNYKLVISQIDGAWTDNSEPIPGFPRWSCPDGEGFFLGVCTGVFATAATGDPIDIPHMRVIMNVGGVFMDAYNAEYTVPAGTGEVEVFFQPNDSQLGDNSGQVHIHVQVCNKSPETFSHTFSFADNQEGWAIQVGTGDCTGAAIGVWEPGEGMHTALLHCSTFDSKALEIKRTFAPRVLTKVSVAFSDTPGSFAFPGFNNLVRSGLSGTLTTLVTRPSDTPGASPMVYTGSQSADEVIIDLTASNTASGVGGGSGHATVISVTIEGQGVDPF